MQLALVQLLDNWGIQPHSVTGHSSGEIAAAYAADALSFESCLAIAYHRGLSAQKISEDFPGIQGAMLALGTNPNVATGMISALKCTDVTIACINSPSSITASGTAQAIDELKEAAETRKIFARKLDVDVAYHSAHMKLVAEHYRSALGKIKPSPSKKALFYSSLTGVKVNTLALGTTYWVNNLTSPVQFAKAFQSCCSLDDGKSLPEHSVTHVVEIGPHSALKAPIRDILAVAQKKKYKIGYSSALVRKENGVVSIMNLASELFMRGCDVNLAAINLARDIDTRKVLSDLPPYPWNHENKYWHESRITRQQRLGPHPRHDILGCRIPESSDLEPSWRNILRLDDVPWVRL